MVIWDMAHLSRGFLSSPLCVRHWCSLHYSPCLEQAQLDSLHREQHPESDCALHFREELLWSEHSLFSSWALARIRRRPAPLSASPPRSDTARQRKNGLLLVKYHLMGHNSFYPSTIRFTQEPLHTGVFTASHYNIHSRFWTVIAPHCCQGEHNAAGCYSSLIRTTCLMDSHVWEGRSGP